MSVKKFFNHKAFVKALDESPYNEKELADMLGCYLNDIYRYKRGESVPRMGRLKQLIEIFGTSIVGLGVSTNDTPKYRLTAIERQHLNWFLSLPVFHQARMLGAFATVYEFGRDADAGFAADLAERLILEEEQSKEQPG